MLNTFDALANFDSNNNAINENPTVSAVDMSAIINRLNDLESKINSLLQKNTVVETQQVNNSSENESDDFPTRGKNESDDFPTRGKNDETGD